MILRRPEDNAEVPRDHPNKPNVLRVEVIHGEAFFRKHGYTYLARPREENLCLSHGMSMTAFTKFHFKTFQNGIARFAKLSDSPQGGK